MPAKMTHYTVKTRSVHRLDVRIPLSVYIDFMDVAHRLGVARGRRVSDVAVVVECIRVAHERGVGNGSEG